MKTKKTSTLFCSVVLTSLIGSAGLASAATFTGPVNYLSAADSPFDGLNFTYFHLEDFEDQLLNVPGVTATEDTGVTSVVFGADFENIDSVDADDGVIDGSGSDGDSYFGSNGASGITFTFDSTELGSLPTHVGVVWTDGFGTTSFEALDSNGTVLGTIGPVSIANAATNGATDEDSFFGVFDSNGISSVTISNTSGGIEIDHLQYGLASVPDGDEDGIADSLDNCTTVANASQIDTDNDGYGNACDGDFNNDCSINFTDIASFSNEFLGSNALYDLNGDGAVNFTDFVSLTNSFLSVPGPGLGACDAVSNR